MDSNLIDQIRRSNDIVDVISQYLPIKRAGSSFKALCPFHNDSHPSLNISQQKQIFKCFACGKAGNVITFVQEYEKLSFIEALKKLAQRAGIVIPEHEKTKIVSSKRDLLLKIYQLTKEFYSDNLFKYGEHVLEYLKQRQITPETAKSLDLGYALNSTGSLKNYLLKQGFAVSILKECGLFGFYQGNLIDLFQERLMFPIHNNTGEVIAFGGRAINPNEPSKYINSPSTELYTKGRELYGLYKTKYDISKADFSLVCEGYIDFLRLYGSGITNCVASLGTSLTEDQIYLLGRYSSNIYMLYDGDLAGQKAALRAALLILSKGFIPKIVLLPDNEDPDSFLVKHGKDVLCESIKSAKSLISFIYENTDLGMSTKEKLDNLTDAIRQVRDPIQKDFLVKETAETFFISEGAIRQKVRQGTRQYSTEYDLERVEQYPEEKNLLILALKDENNYNLLAHELNSDYFLNEKYKKVYLYLTAQDRTGDINEPARLLDQIEDIAIKEQIADLLFEELPLVSFGQTLHEVIVRKLQADLAALDRRIKTEQNKMDLLIQREELNRQLNELIPHVTKKLIE